MVNLDQVEVQLRRVGCSFRFWGKPEVRELCNILVPGEVIAQCVNGRYENGFALLCVTNHRLLLIDKKPMFLNLTDLRFDMIAELDYSAQLLGGTVRVLTPNRTLTFMSWNKDRLRTILNYTQQRVTEIRQHYIQRQFQNQSNAPAHHTAPFMGSLAMAGDQSLPINPYTTASLTLRRRRVPKFY